jgi:hypothetical protein
MDTKAKNTRTRSFKIVPVQLTQAMMLSAVETAGINPAQAQLANEMFQTAAPDIEVPPLGREIVEFAKVTAEARSRELGDAVAYLDVFAATIQELLVASMGARLQETFPRRLTHKDVAFAQNRPARQQGGRPKLTLVTS